jgi:KEOPS complex subunit Cgi121
MMDREESAFEIRNACVNIQDRETFLRSLRMIGQDYGSTIICFDADLMVGRRHAELAIRLALRSFLGNAAIANSLEMEALLYASGSRQCSVASLFGIHEGENHSFVCCCPPGNDIWDALRPLMQFHDGDWKDVGDKKQSHLKSLFSISDEELAVAGESRFSDLVLERVALLEVYR